MSTPFTGPERAAIRQYLGYSELFKDLDPRLEGMLDQIDSRAPDAQARIRSTLAILARVDADIDAVASGGELVLKQGEDGVVFAGEDHLTGLQRYGRTLIQRMAITLELQVKRDYYGSEDSASGAFVLG